MDVRGMVDDDDGSLTCYTPPLPLAHDGDKFLERTNHRRQTTQPLRSCTRTAINLRPVPDTISHPRPSSSAATLHHRLHRLARLCRRLSGPSDIPFGHINTPAHGMYSMMVRRPARDVSKHLLPPHHSSCQLTGNILWAWPGNPCPGCRHPSCAPRPKEGSWTSSMMAWQQACWVSKHPPAHLPSM